MTDIRCLYPDRQAVLVAHLYDDDIHYGSAERVAFETHVATCQLCRTELAELRGVRSTLAQWDAPEALTVNHRSPLTDHRSPAWWHDVPVWAQVAAAMLVLGVSASIANLDVRYDRVNGLNVRTGWSQPATVAAPARAAAVVQTQAADHAASRDDLAALRAELRSEIRAQSATVRAASLTPAPVSAVAASEEEFERRVRALLDESEKNQKKELAVRLVQLQRDFNALLQNERGQTNQLFRDVTNTYGPQLLSQQKQINYLLPAGR